MCTFCESHYGTIAISVYDSFFGDVTSIFLSIRITAAVRMGRWRVAEVKT